MHSYRNGQWTHCSHKCSGEGGDDLAYTGPEGTEDKEAAK